MEQEIVIALGGNIDGPHGPPVESLRRALADLSSKSICLKRLSRFFRTPCFPEGAGPDFLNAAAILTPIGTSRTPESVLSQLHDTEAAFGRERKLRWGTRTLDLDLIAVGGEIAPNPTLESHWRTLPLARQMRETPDRLILPHPRLAERAFVLVPLCDIAPDWRHPVTGLTVREMTDALPAAARAEVVPLSSKPALVKSV